MKTLAFSIYDSKGEAYMTPFFSQSKGTALRMFMDEVANPKSVINHHPEDYSLFHVGEFDELRGVIIPVATPLSLGVAIEFLKKADMPSCDRPLPGQLSLVDKGAGL